MEMRFVQDVLRNRHVRAILESWEKLALADGWLVAGCLFQTVWNLRTGAPPEAGIKDYDIFYFDGADLSAEAERTVQGRVGDALQHVPVPLEAMNQARVHLWYPRHFGKPYAQLHSSRDGIERFLVPCTCVAIRPAGDGHEVYAPYGLEDLYAGILKPNPLMDHRDLFRAKAASYAARWPWLRVSEDAAAPRP